jgi:putative ABC transport system permease protein
MRTFEFLSLAWKRLKGRPLLSLLLVLNTALSVGITLGIPVFSGAVSRRILQQEINARSQIRGWPMFSVRVNAQATDWHPIDIEEATAAREWLEDMLREALNLPVTSVNVEVQSEIYRLAPRPGDDRYTTEYLAGVQVVYVEDVKEHIRVTEGSPFGQISDPAQLNVWVERSFAQELVIQVGEEYDLGELFSSEGEVIPIKVAGFWEASDPTEHFWPERPQGHFDGSFLITAEQFESYILQDAEGQTNSVAWYYVFDDRRVRLDRADQYIDGLRRVSREIERGLPDGRIDLDPGEDLLRGQRRKASLSVVLFGFSVPLLVILAYSMSSLSETQSRLQEQEVSMMVSRGSTAWQLLLVSAMESLLIIIAAIPIGIVLALVLAHLLGYATGFLSFTLQNPLPVSLVSANWTPMIAVALASLVIRLRTTWQASRRTVISYEQTHSRQTLFWSAMRAFYMALLILVTVYAYRQLVSRGTILTSLDALDPRNDPLVLLAPTLFIFTAPLLAAEAFVWLVHPIGLVGRFLPRVSGYLASMNLVRAGRQHRASIYRLTLSLTLGVFYASVAKSADIWLVDSMQHQYGADLVIKLTAEQGSRFGTFGSSDQEMIEVPTLSSDIYRSLQGVRAATRVGEFEATLQPATDIPYYRLLAVERLSFPQVAYFRSDYAREPLGELMNRLAQEPKGILLPSSIAAAWWPEVGDIVQVSINMYGDTRLRFAANVVGFFDHFPTMYPDEQPVLVVNLDYLELNAGIVPHDVWISLEQEADTEAVLRDINRLGIPLREVKELNQALKAESQRLERAGIFGLLSFCFVAGAALSVADVLVYTTAMLRERALHHAVLRALGLERRAVLVTVVLEQSAALVYGLSVGIACGVLCAMRYGPYFPLGSGSNPPVPPFVAYVDWIRAWWIALLTGAALLLAQVIVLIRMTRTHLFQVLRMGMRS